VILQGTEPRKLRLSQRPTDQPVDVKVPTVDESSTGEKETCNEVSNSFPLNGWKLASYYNVTGKFASLRYPSHLLHIEEVMLRQGISAQQAKSAYLTAKNIFSRRSPESTVEAFDAKAKHSSILALYAEHRRLREEVVCQRGQSRDNATKVEICARHRELGADIRHNYLKIGRRLETLQQQTSTRLPLFTHGAFAGWYRKHQDL